MGKTIYLSDEQLKLLRRVLDSGNFSCETDDEEYDEKVYMLRDQIVEKLEK